MDGQTERLSPYNFLGDNLPAILLSDLSFKHLQLARCKMNDLENNIDLLFYDDMIEKGYGSRATIWRKVKKGTFPQPIDCGGRPAWPVKVITKWLNEKISQAAAGRLK